MTGLFLSTHGSFLFLCGLGLGFVFRSRNPRFGFTRAARQLEAGHEATWNAVTWTDTAWIDSDPAFSPQLLNLHHALRQHESAEIQHACVKRRTPTA